MQRIRRRGALLIVIEIDEDDASLFLPGLDPPGPNRKRVGAIPPFVAAARPVPPDIDEIGGALPRRRRIVMVRDAERDILVGEQPQDPRGVPARKPEFKTIAALFREQPEEGTKPIGVGLKIRRPLKQDGSG